ncbi:MAG: hypothetical protein AAGK97_05640 [Bacteroidota bacterium]
MLQDLSKILSFRIRQAYRFIQSIGAIYILLVAFVISGVFLNFLQSVLTSANPFYGLLFLLFPIGIHISRKDQGFLKLMDVPKQLLYLLEYNIISLPSYFILMLSNNWKGMLYLAIGILLIAMTNLQWKNNVRVWNLNWIPAASFEIRSGVRKQFISIAFIYVLALGFSFFVGTLPLFLFFLALILASFYEDIEDKFLIEHYASKQFLNKKILHHVGFTQLLLLPHYFTFLIFNSSYYLILIACIVFISMVQAFAIIYKYNGYYPGRRKALNSVAVGIFTLAVMVPFFFPITFIMLFWYYQKAKKNLNLFYDNN